MTGISSTTDNNSHTHYSGVRGSRSSLKMRSNSKRPHGKKVYKTKTDQNLSQIKSTTPLYKRLLNRCVKNIPAVLFVCKIGIMAELMACSNPLEAVDYPIAYEVLSPNTLIPMLDYLLYDTMGKVATFNREARYQEAQAAANEFTISKLRYNMLAAFYQGHWVPASLMFGWHLYTQYCQFMAGAIKHPFTA